ncbi:MAG: DUF2993 domain-containing protein [Actinomycetia bacterium]|nr:DUF2993 domain-containing protein [Actinomycetes bacterium]
MTDHAQTRSAAKRAERRVRHRRRLWLTVLIAFVALLVAADRVGVLVAQRAAASKLAGYAQFADRPSVRIHGVPFLTQVIGGKYDDVAVRADAVRVGALGTAKLDVRLHGLRLSASELIHRKVDQLRVDRVTGTVTWPYQQVAAHAGIAGLTLAPVDGGVAVTASVTVPGFGALTVSGSGQFAVVDGSLRLTVRDVRSATSGALPSALAGQLAGALNATIPLPALPYGLRVAGVTAGPDGLAVSGAGANVLLSADSS